MSASDDVKAQADIISQSSADTAAAYADFQSQITAIDPATPGASDKIAAIVAQKETMRVANKQIMDTAIDAAGAVSFGILGIGKAEAQAYLYAAIATISSVAVPAKDAFKVAVDAKQAEIAAVPPSSEPAGTSASSPIPVSTTGLTGSADGDSGGDKGGSAIPTTTAGAAVTAASGNTPNSAAPAAKGSKKLPKDFPERMSNPLSKFSSYTYQLSLYMLSPDAYNQYSAGFLGKTLFTSGPDGGPSVGARLIAQSGGANRDLKTDVRAPGFELDYYIDNLKIISAT